MISLQTMGDNSCYIEYNRDSLENLQTTLDNFIVDHGWTKIKEYDQAGYNSISAFKSFNKNNI